MARLQEKIQDLSLAMFVVRSLRKKCRSANQHFVCNQDIQDIVVEIDEFSGGAHVMEVNMPMRCQNYDAHAACNNADCPNRDWNNQYIDLLNRFWVARRARNQAILNLFKIRKK
jgi:hypothetical protein